MFFRRPQIGSRTLGALVCVWLLALTNFTFWPLAKTAFGGFDYDLVSFAVVVAALLLAGLVALSVKYLIKPVFILLLVIAAVASYFMDNFGTIINREMIENAVTTTTREAGPLATPEFFAHLLFLGVLPSLLIVWVQVRHETFFIKAARNLLLIVPLVLLSAGLFYTNFGNFILTLKQNHDLMDRLNPVGPIAAAVNLAQASFAEKDVVAAPIGTDARRGPLISASTRPVVTVLVLGETARAQNFSLNGYGRDTNPELSKLNIFNFSNASSCGTDTGVSVPCMFSIFPRLEYSQRKAKGTESLLDVIHHAGIDAIWWDNNTGSKRVADRVSFTSLTDEKDPLNCPEGECTDGIFLDRLDALLAGVTRDTVIVLHQIGSHGPSYFRRHPEAFRVFTPDCRNPDLPDCTPEELVNAYDNTILYTDHILASVIGLLDKHGDRETGAMFYMSDHGESLGENGLYLHGAPYAIAPRTQTHVPMIAWFSDAYTSLMKVDRACLANRATNDYSHDNYFHTVLGMMNVETRVYDAGLDAFRPCRTQN